MALIILANRGNFSTFCNFSITHTPSYIKLFRYAKITLPTTKHDSFWGLYSLLFKLDGKVALHLNYWNMSPWNGNHYFFWNKLCEGDRMSEGFWGRTGNPDIHCRFCSAHLQQDFFWNNVKETEWLRDFGAGLEIQTSIAGFVLLTCSRICCGYSNHKHPTGSKKNQTFSNVSDA